jgi:DNA repair protein SbcC/Rad50
MLIKSINLNNIRSYINQKIDFSLGTTLLSGDIGSGKSSILLALEFALFGVKRGELTSDSILRNGCTSGSVELILEINNQEIIIKRTLKRTKDSIKQDSGFIVIDNVKHELTPVEMKSKIYSLLGYPLNLISKSKDYLFRFTVYTPQEDMKQILTESSETRLETLRKLFNIDKYKKIIENTSIYVKKIKNKKNEMKGSILDLSSKLNEFEERNNEIKKIDEKHKNKNNLLNEIRIKLKEKETEINKVEEDIKLFNELNSSIELINQRLEDKFEVNKRLNNKINLLNKDLVELNNKIDFEEEKHDDELKIRNKIEIKNKEINELQSEKKILISKIDSLNNEIKKIENNLNKNLINELNIKKNKLNEISNKINNKNNLEEELELLIKEKEEINIQLSTSKNKSIESERTINELSLKNTCPLCRQNINHEHKENILKLSKEDLQNYEELKLNSNKKIILIEENIKTLKNQIIEINKLESIFESLKIEIKNFEEKINQNNIYELEIENYKKELIILNDKLNNQLDESKIKEIEEELKNYKNNLNKCLIYKQKIEKINLIKNEINNKNKEIDTIKKDILSNEEEISNLNQRRNNLIIKKEKLNFINEKYVEIKKEFNIIKENEKNIEILIAEINKEKETIFKFISNLEKEINHKKEIEKNIDKIEKIQDWLEKNFIPTTNVIEKTIFTKIYIEFNEIFERWLNFLIGEDNLSARLNDDFSPLISQNGYESDYNNLSGGEKQSVALAYRLALNHVLNSLIQNINTRDILILDEPTDGFSYEQLDKIRDILDEIKIKQIIIVSHEPKIESFVNNVIKINKENHISNVLN